MNIIQAPIKDVGIGFAKNVHNLSVIREPACAVALCQQQPDLEILEWFDQLDPNCLPKARLILRPDRVNQVLQEICDVSGPPDCEVRKLLINDVTDLANAFADFMKAVHIRLRFDVVTTNACRKFHIDAVTARLICTYRGTGTQYGYAIGQSEPNHVFTAPTGSPIILRGTLWPEFPKADILHRSPPIEGTGEYRSVLVIDPIFDLETAD